VDERGTRLGKSGNELLRRAGPQGNAVEATLLEPYGLIAEDVHGRDDVK
jgi:hypothetical protein